MAEFGVVIAKRSTTLREVLSGVIEDASNELSGLDRLVIERAQLMGVGPISASAVVATVGDFKPFKNGA